MNMEFSSEKAPFVKLFRVPVFIPVPSLTYLVKGGRGKYWGVCFVLGLTAIFLFDLYLENKLQRAKKCHKTGDDHLVKVQEKNIGLECILCIGSTLLYESALFFKF